MIKINMKQFDISITAISALPYQENGDISVRPHEETNSPTIYLIISYHQLPTTRI